MPHILDYGVWENEEKLLMHKKFVEKNFEIKKPELNEVEKELEVEAESIKSPFFWKNNQLRSDYVKSNKINRLNRKMEEWNAQRKQFEIDQDHVKEEIEKENYSIDLRKEEIKNKILPGDPNYISDKIAEITSNLRLAVEFSIDYHYSSEILYIDLDLPEIEDLPTKKAQKLKDGKVSIKEKNRKELNRDYLCCVSGLGYFLTGNLFNISPMIQSIQMSGYTQRISKKTGNIEDTYIYSIRFNREKFSQLNFEEIDPLDALTNFEYKMNYDSKFEAKEIEPFNF